MLRDDARHPDRMRLAEFALGTLAQDASLTVEWHLEGCAHCCRELEAVPADSLIDLIRSSAAARTSAVRSALSPGYEILGEIGRGGMGVVYKARQRGLGRIVALKRLRSGSLANGDDLARFRREAEALARLQHPNIVQVFEAGEQDGHPFLALEYVAGPSLRERLERSPLPAREAARLLAVLADAVEYAHGQGVAHRDLKPGNVLLVGDVAEVRDTATEGRRDAALEPKIADFGLAKLFDIESDQTRTGLLVGTPGYMAPEQSRGSPALVGPAADVYSLGAILYEALTGRPPFRAATPLETIELVHACDPIAPRRLQPHLPRDLETICLKCLRHEPLARYPAAASLADDLRRFLGGRAISARAAGGLERSWKWFRRRPAMAALCILALLGAGGAALGTAMHQRQLQLQTERAEGNYRAAWAAIRRLLGRVDERRWTGTADLSDLKREQLREALPFFERTLAEPSSTDPAARTDRINAHRELAVLQIALGMRGEAEAHLKEAIRILKTPGPAPARPPADLELLATCYNNLGLLFTYAGDNDKRVASYQLALDTGRQLQRSDPDWRGIESMIAELHRNLGIACRAAGKPEIAEEHIRQSLSLRKKLWTAAPESAEASWLLADTLLALASIAGAERPDEALKAVEQSESLLKPLAERSPRSTRDNVALATTYVAWGQLLEPADDEGALRKYALAQTILEDVHRREPASEWARSQLSTVYRSRSRQLERLERHSDALSDWDRAVDLAIHRDDHRHCRMQRTMALVRADQHARACAEATALAEDARLPPNDVFRLAAVCALSIRPAREDVRMSPDERSAAAGRYAEEAIAILRKSANAGFFREVGLLQNLRFDPNLNLLRERDDFRELLAAVEASQTRISGPE